MERYENLIKDFESKHDNETQHMKQDEIYREFIKDIANSKYSLEDSKKIATLIKTKIIKKDKERWYA